MVDFLDRFSLKSLGELRSSVSAGTAQNNVEIVPGVYLSWDDEGTGIEIAYDSPEWAALSLDYKMPQTPRWLSLNLALAEGWFEAGDVIGLVVEGYAADMAEIGVMLRSKIEDDLHDCDWYDAIKLYPENGVSVSLRTLDGTDGVTGVEGYHTLILRLPVQDQALTIRNLRVFRVPGSVSMPDRLETLSSIATV